MAYRHEFLSDFGVVALAWHEIYAWWILAYFEIRVINPRISSLPWECVCWYLIYLQFQGQKESRTPLSQYT